MRKPGPLTVPEMQRLDRLAREIRTANAETQAGIVATRRQIAALQAQAVLLGHALEKARAIAPGDFETWLSVHCPKVRPAITEASMKVAARPDGPALDVLRTLGVFDQADSRPLIRAG